MPRIFAFLGKAVIKAGKGFYVLVLYIFTCAVIGGLAGALLLLIFGPSAPLLGACVGGIIGLISFLIAVANKGFDETVAEFNFE